MAKKTKTEKKFDFKKLKSFEAFCKAENIDPIQLPGVDNLPEKFRKPLIAAYKIMVGVSAVNEGKKVNFTNDEPKYFPWARVNSSGSGFDFSLSSYDYVRRLTSNGSRLCSHTPEQTKHVFNVLNDEYKDWLI